MLDTDNTGHNNPPPHVAWAEHAESLTELAQGLGEIATEDQAESVGKVAADAKKALSDVKAAVTAARKPHMDAAAAISADFKPIIDELERVKKVAVTLLDGWIAKQRAAEAERARVAAEAARKADEEARAAKAMADQTDVDELAKADEAAAAARFAEQEARAARHAKTTVTGVQYRTTGYDVEITDSRVLWKHIAETDPDGLAAMLQGWADKRARSTSGAFLPGCTVKPIRKAV